MLLLFISIYYTIIHNYHLFNFSQFEVVRHVRICLNRSSKSLGTRRSTGAPETTRTLTRHRSIARDFPEAAVPMAPKAAGSKSEQETTLGEQRQNKNKDLKELK